MKKEEIQKKIDTAFPLLIITRILGMKKKMEWLQQPPASKTTTKQENESQY